MLEAKELYKVYKPKKGVAVTALNKVSIKFPDKGMVFLLGKSGSGKSTLLNLLGGLDKYDSGEIIIKGVSSKSFNQQHFDSYRNTYIGFIFQEYNILEEFSVGANIALALELQGRKATDEEINEILKEVDLEGYGNRKPNELSGGQKQRVAIARALVKKPEIIMADEPTGALDSNTGRQVFDTLKKLSKDKLVIIVSHDREFSEKYADRIIELADGSIISDVELVNNDEIPVDEGNLKFNGEIIEVSAGYHLTEDDRIAINQYIDQISGKDMKLKLVDNKVSAKRFVPTNEENIESNVGSPFKLIKSKLPLKSAFKIGAGGLKYKKFRLVMTILLSCVAFGLFGLADTFSAYKHIDTCTNSLIDSDVDYVSLVKAKKYGSGIEEYYDSYQRFLTDEDIEKIEKNINQKFTGVVNPKNSYLEFYSNFDSSINLTETNMLMYATGFSGFAEITQETLDTMGYTILAGELPDGNKNEIAISKYIFETFRLSKYTDGVSGDNGIVYQEIKEYSDLIGKTITINEVEFTVTAIIDTNFDFDRYADLDEKKDYTSNSERLVNYVLFEEFLYARDYSFASVAMVGDGYVDMLLEKEPETSVLRDVFLYFYSDFGYIDPTYICELDKVKSQEIIWVDGEKSELKDNEIIVTSDMLMLYEDMYNGEELTEENMSSFELEILKKASWTIDMYLNDTDENIIEGGYKVVGIIEIGQENYGYGNTVIVSDKIFSKCVTEENGEYAFAITSIPKDRAEIFDMVSFCYGEGEDVHYEIQNAVTYELDTINSLLKGFSKIFLYIGIGFAVFASLMLANFIGNSISHKKQEIGILRAIGSRSNDVFRIFFSESFIIAMINFIFSSVGVFIATTLINSLIRSRTGILVTVLSFGPRQIILLLVISIFVATISSFIPVKKIASKKPIDAIRNR